MGCDQMRDIVLKVQDVSKQYTKDSSFVFSNLNLELYCGEILSIVGNNGSGKSTLLRMIAGLEPITESYMKVFQFKSHPKTFSYYRKLPSNYFRG